MRSLLAVLAAAALAAAAGLISGEQAMTEGVLPLAVAVLLGLCESELVSVIWRGRGAAPRVIAALAAALGVAWGVSIDAGGFSVGPTGRVAPLVAAVVAAVSFRRSAPPASDTPTEP